MVFPTSSTAKRLSVFKEGHHIFQTPTILKEWQNEYQDQEMWNLKSCFHFDKFYNTESEVSFIAATFGNYSLWLKLTKIKVSTELLSLSIWRFYEINLNTNDFSDILILHVKCFLFGMSWLLANCKQPAVV